MCHLVLSVGHLHTASLSRGVTHGRFQVQRYLSYALLRLKSAMLCCTLIHYRMDVK